MNVRPVLILVVGVLAWLVSESCRAGVPIVFEPNRGQAQDDVRFLARIEQDLVCIGDDGATFWRTGDDGVAHALRLRFVGARARSIDAVDPLASCSNYIRGADPSRWILGVTHSSAVLLDEIAAGIDVRMYANGSALEYDVIVAPGADVTAVRVAFDGATHVALDDDGTLRIETPAGIVLHSAPHVIQSDGDARRIIAAKPVLAADGTLGFELEDYDAARAVVIDPVVGYATYFGGAGHDAVRDVAVAQDGSIVLVGSTQSPNLPFQQAVQTVLLGQSDAFVARMNPAGTALLWCTYFGGTSGSTLEMATDVGIDASGRVVVGGNTDSTDFPTSAGAIQLGYGGNGDAFVARFSSAGNQLLYSTLIGGGELDTLGALDVDGLGNIACGGRTSSSDMPVASAAFPSYLGAEDAWVARFTTTDALDFLTYFGTDFVDATNDIEIGLGGDVVVAGAANGDDLPLGTSPMQTYGNGFVARFQQGGALIASTYTQLPVVGLATDALDAVWVVGGTNSSGIKTSYACLQKFHSGSQGVSGSNDSWIERIASDLSALEAGTLFGVASSSEIAWDVVVNPFGEPTVLMTSTGNFFPYNSTARVAHWNAWLTRQSWYTTLPSGSEGAFAFARAPTESLWVAGLAGSAFTPIAGALQPVGGGLDDGYVLRLDPTPATTLVALDAYPARLRHGGQGSCVLTLDGAAPAGGLTLAVSSSDPALVVPPVVIVPAGAASVEVILVAGLVPAPLSATVTVTGLGTSKSATIQLVHGPFFAIDVIETFGATSPGTGSPAAAINASGQVAGTHFSTLDPLWSLAGFVFSDATGFSDFLSYARDLNDAGAVCTQLGTKSFVRTAAGAQTQIPAVSGFTGYYAEAINAGGQVVGMMDNVNTSRAWRYTPGTGTKNLGNIGGGGYSAAADVNDLGHVVGETQTTTFNTVPFRYIDGIGMKSLGVPPGASYAKAFGINNLDQVVGTQAGQFGNEFDAFRWSAALGYEFLGRLPGDKTCIANEISDSGVTVGQSSNWNNVPRAVFHTDADGLMALADVVDPFEGWIYSLDNATDVNAHGVVAAEGGYSGGYPDGAIATGVAFRLLPVGPRFENYGQGTPGTLGVPKLTSTKRPAICAPIQLSIGNSRGQNTPALLVLSAFPANLPLGSATLLVQPSITVPFVLPTTGALFGGNIPCDTSYVGIELYLQVLEEDPGAPSGVSATPGLKLTIG